MAQALYRKWRSRTFEEVIGQEHVTTTLRNALREGRVAHAYLFSGPRGTGKTSTARILAKALNCTAEDEASRPCDQCSTCIAINEGRMLDLIEIDAASNNSVDDVRELRDKVGFRPGEGRFKVYIIDEVHMLSPSAFNALLKTLEEPPPHARFVLATTEPHKIPATVISRCQRFDFRRIPVPEIASHLAHIAKAEGVQAEEAALLAIARSAQGCMRDAVSLLDQMTSYGAETITRAQVDQVLGSVAGEAVSAFVDVLAAKDVAAGLRAIHDLLLRGASLHEFCGQVVEHLRCVMLAQLAGDGLLQEQPPETVAQMEKQAQALSKEETLWAIKRFSEAQGELKGGLQPQLPLELALVESIQGPASVPAPSPQAAQAQTAAPARPGGDSARSQGQAKSATPARSPAAAEQPGPPLDTAAIEKLRSQWNDFLLRVRDRCGPKEQAALRSVRDVAIGGNSVALAFGANSFTRGVISEPATKEKIAKILGELLGQPVNLVCQSGDSAVLSASAGRVVQAQESQGPDPLVEYAVSELGAAVVDEPDEG